MGSYSDPNITPPMGQAAPLGLQHVLAMFASNVTPSVIVAGAAGLQFGGAEQVYLIQMAMLFAGIATLFQTIGFGPIGARLPIMQGTSFAFVGVLAGIAAIEDIEFQKKSVLHNTKWMGWFEKELEALDLDFQTSVTNFLLIKFPNKNLKSAQNAEKFLADKGILVRGMNAYGLSNYLRVSIGNEEENIIFIKELKKFLDNQK